MQEINCTFQSSNESCPNCGGALTPAKYYTALKHETSYQPRRKSSSHTVTSFSNVSLRQGGLCVNCGKTRSAQLIKTEGVIMGISAAITVAFFLVTAIEVLPTWAKLLLFALGAISLIVCLTYLFRIMKYLVAKVRLKNEAKFSEKSLSITYATLYSPPEMGDEEVYPITKYDYLQKTHRSG